MSYLKRSKAYSVTEYNKKRMFFLCHFIRFSQKWISLREKLFKCSQVPVYYIGNVVCRVVDTCREKGDKHPLCAAGTRAFT